ncbi:SDR family NAD(P)-dependent oxidoreductase [Paenibacillus sp. PsM32]|uniref:SDR family NAD(P)-dependent oxidoreductase n=1 Tax=Paenibacillus kyungheensis TaxID=1452732 RepID=A0AAX3LYU4_9BACL|nr:MULTISPECIES: SDR family oxidoreductase [Paenibacillus]MDN4620437.1 SDR family NAD(P)-dependent oxidoreductase [Paenibacillus sp. PsM32]MDQ1235658.1 glucose 1-dehydrogenase [Paenibacillus sp. SORGH_AS_0306]MDR6112707.1 glucose 1-dehydrogenase [Paenibacillus sp. SORGH_AS_0338]WCT55164.1 SDR family NAD(P)-dependent oxidoreductase [Paenibacillus kyungheensis]WDF51680.1 SDR family NAD(P)-dependent oxidoreductase [Paenibacillus sp. KACC 21273]
MNNLLHHRNRKVALITGAGIGLGRGIAKVLAHKGYRIALTYHSESDDIDNVTQELSHIYGAQPFAIQTDLTQPDQPESVIKQTLEHFGRIDLLVNNAGGGNGTALLDLEMGDLDHSIHLNYRAPILASKYAAQAMIDQEIAGNIIFITSSRAERAYPTDSIYGGMKAALIRSAASFALEFAPYGIRVNCVGPGATVNRLEYDAIKQPLGRKIPLGRMGTPADIGKAVAWLSSDDASYITGINLRVDGGLILPGMPEDTSPEAGYGWGVIYDHLDKD